MARRTRREVDLDNCRAVVYTWGPAGRKGSRKCAACEWYFIPSVIEYPFHDVNALDTKGLVYLTGEQWYAETGCCPNCEPRNSTVKYGWRRNLGLRSRGDGWCRNRGSAYEWFPVESQYSRAQEAKGKNRRQMPVHLSGQPSQMRAQMLRAGTGVAERLGRTPTEVEFQNHGLRGQRIVDVFGSHRGFVLELGLGPRQPGQTANPTMKGHRFAQRYNDKELRKLARGTMRARNHIMSKSEWDKEVGYPCAQTIAARLGGGSWRRVCVLMGYEPNPQGWSEETMKKGLPQSLLARGLNPDEVGKKAYEILNDPDSDHNQQRREVERKTEHYTQELLEAHERFEQAKFRRKEVIS